MANAIPNNEESQNNRSLFLSVSDIFDEVKKRTELRSRSLSDANSDSIIITDADYPLIAETWIKDFVADAGNRLGALDELKLFDSESIDDQEIKHKVPKSWQPAGPLIRKAAVHYVLSEWYDSLSFTELALLEQRRYKQHLSDFRTNSAQESTVKPKWQPYF